MRTCWEIPEYLNKIITEYLKLFGVSEYLKSQFLPFRVSDIRNPNFYPSLIETFCKTNLL